MPQVSLFVALLIAAACALAGEPRYEELVMTDNKKIAKDKRAFTPRTAKIFLLAKLADVPEGAKLSGVWIAEKTRVAPANYKIGSSQLTVDKVMSVVTFSLSKPKPSWPVGDYRVELFINGKPAAKVPFRIAKPAATANASGSRG